MNATITLEPNGYLKVVTEKGTHVMIPARTKNPAPEAARDGVEILARIAETS
jgi:hypothetical protein